MKYFRVHPDLLVIANYPDSKQTVRTIAKALKNNKKILLLTDAHEKIAHNALPAGRQGFITRTAWVKSRPLSFRKLIHRLLYNHQATTAAIVYQPALFGPFWTTIFTPALVIILRASRKRVVCFFSIRPKSPPYPTIHETFTYWAAVLFRWILRIISSSVIIGEKTTGKQLAEELFPHPTTNLGLVHLMKKESLL